MKEENENKERFRADSKMMVDKLFDNDLFKERLTRDEMKSLEDWICSTMSMRYDSEKRVNELLDSIKKTHNENRN